MLSQLVTLQGERRSGRRVARERFDEVVAPTGIMPLASKGCCLGDVSEFFELALIEGLPVGLLA